jgi:DNA topoisomerase-1
MLNALKTKKPGNPVIGTTDDGLPIFYCSGKYGDYWQIGDVATSPDVKRFTVPKDLLGVNVSKDDILAFFALPRTVGKTEDGQEITANIGKYGPYLKCGDTYCNRKNSLEILYITEQEARKVISEGSRQATSSRKSSSATKKSSTANPVIVKDFGVQEGEHLDIRQGRYGYYLKHGSENYRLAPKYQHDEQACIQMPLEEALAAIKKS